MGNVINVGISDMNIAKGGDTLATYALGSCVGICLYDTELKIAGLAHIMLPWSKESSAKSDNKRRYADTGITELIQMMVNGGANKDRMVAKIAGGAQMFKTNSTVFNIGDRNVDAVKIVLRAYKINIIAQETGLDYGRTVFFSSEDGVMEVRAAMKGTKRV